MLDNLVHCLRISCKDGGNFIIDFLEIVQINFGKLGIPVAIPVTVLLFVSLGTIHLSLLQVIIQLLNCLALVQF